MRSSAFAKFSAFLIVVIAVVWPVHAATELVTGESARLVVLQRAFPDAARISPAQPNQTRREPYILTDLLGREVARLSIGLEWQYEVDGPVAKEEEESATDITAPDDPRSTKRQVSMQLYRWKPAANGEALLVGILHYSFPMANPARCCTALGRILLLSSTADRILDTYAKVPHAFTAFQSVRFVDTDGSGAEKLMVGADSSGPGSMSIHSVLFTLSGQKLTPILAVNTAVLYADPRESNIQSLVLDESQTIRTKGQRFVFTQKTFAEKTSVRTKPRTTRVSYPIGYGLPSP